MRACRQITRLHGCAGELSKLKLIRPATAHKEERRAQTCIPGPPSIWARRVLGRVVQRIFFAHKRTTRPERSHSWERSLICFHRPYKSLHTLRKLKAPKDVSQATTWRNTCTLLACTFVLEPRKHIVTATLTPTNSQLSS